MKWEMTTAWWDVEGGVSRVAGHVCAARDRAEGTRGVAGDVLGAAVTRAAALRDDVAKVKALVERELAPALEIERSLVALGRVVASAHRADSESADQALIEALVVGLGEPERGGDGMAAEQSPGGADPWVTGTGSLRRSRELLRAIALTIADEPTALERLTGLLEGNSTE